MRVPLSPVKANTHRRHGGGPAAKKQKGQGIIGTKQPALDAAKTVTHARVPVNTRIPVPSPAAAPTRHTANPEAVHVTSAVQPRGASTTKIPRFTPPTADPVAEPLQVPERGRTLLPGFLAYSNPSFAGEAAETPSGAQEGGLPTPGAMQVLQHINNSSPGAQSDGVRGILNCYLRTGPKSLSPDPNGHYCIPAPNPAAVEARGIMNFTAPGGVGVAGAVHEFLRTGAHQLSPEPGHEGQAAIKARPPVMGVPLQAAVRRNSVSAIPAPPAAATTAPAAQGALATTPEGAAPESGALPSSVSSNEVALAAPSQLQTEGPVTGEKQQHELSLYVHLLPAVEQTSGGGERAPITWAAEGDASVAGKAPLSRATSPVAFKLPSDSPDSCDQAAEPAENPQLQEQAPGPQQAGEGLSECLPCCGDA